MAEWVEFHKEENVVKACYLLIIAGKPPVVGK